MLAGTGELPLIVSDLRMPELDGMGFLAEVRRRFPDTAVVMLNYQATLERRVHGAGGAHPGAVPGGRAEMLARALEAKDPRLRGHPDG